MGFNPNEKNIINEEQTSLHYACGQAIKPSIDKLIELGADLSLRDSAGRTHFDMMAFIKDEEVREEYSDEPEMLAKWDEAYDSVSKKVVNLEKKTVRHLRKQYW